MSNYSYFRDEQPHVTVSHTFSTKQFGELEIVGAMMQIIDAKQMMINKVGIGGSIIAMPLIQGDTIYVGACDRNMYALSLDGEEKWRFSAEDVISYPCYVHDGLLFFGSYDSNIYALDADTGKLVWRFAAGGKVFNMPFISKGTLYMASEDGCVYALEEKTGRLVWKIRNSASVNSIGDGERIYYGGLDNTAHACTLDGKVLWSFKANARMIFFGHPFWKGKVYAASGDSNVYALEKATGKLVWKFMAGDQTYPPAADAGKLFMGSRDFNVYCLDAETGRLIWKSPTGGLTTYPAVSEGKVYTGSYDNNVYCMDAANGRQLWRFQTKGFVSWTAVSSGRVYFGSWDCHLYCVDAETGKLIWKFKTSLGTPSPLEPPENSVIRSAQVIWQASEEEAKKAEQGEAQLSDYADSKNEYVSSGMGDYVGKKKRGYV